MSFYLFVICCGLTMVEMTAAVAAEKNGWPWIAGGVVLFIGLFFLYSLSLTQGSLTMVTIGWIFTSQISAVAVDYFFYDKTINRNQFIGVTIILIGVAVMCIPSAFIAEANDALEALREGRNFGEVNY